MTFRCQQCNGVSFPNDKAVRKVLETRKRTYENHHPEKGLIVSQGIEVIKEVMVCSGCA